MLPALLLLPLALAQAEFVDVPGPIPMPSLMTSATSGYSADPDSYDLHFDLRDGPAALWVSDGRPSLRFAIFGLDVDAARLVSGDGYEWNMTRAGEALIAWWAPNEWRSYSIEGAEGETLGSIHVRTVAHRLLAPVTGLMGVAILALGWRRG